MLRVGDVVQYVRRNFCLDGLVVTGDLGTVVAVYPGKPLPYDVWFDGLATKGYENPAIIDSDEIVLVTESIEH